MNFFCSFVSGLFWSGMALLFLVPLGAADAKSFSVL
jgi:hypothetical protein